MNNTKQILTGNAEWYTPPQIIADARAVMGSINTDPASCLAANDIVRAGVYYDSEQDGLSKPWHGNVWCNPPYARGLIQKFVYKALAEIKSGNTQQLIMLTNAATDTEWWQLLAVNADCAVITKGRISFIGADGKPKKGNSMGQSFFYFGQNVGDFMRQFFDHGVVIQAKRYVFSNA